MFLTDEEIADLTGLSRPSAQLAWLRKNGWSWQATERIGFAGIAGAGARFSPHSEFEAIAHKALIGGCCHG